MAVEEHAQNHWDEICRKDLTIGCLNKKKHILSQPQILLQRQQCLQVHVVTLS